MAKRIARNFLSVRQPFAFIAGVGKNTNPYFYGSKALP